MCVFLDKWSIVIIEQGFVSPALRDINAPLTDLTQWIVLAGGLKGPRFDVGEGH